MLGIKNCEKCQDAIYAYLDDLGVSKQVRVFRSRALHPAAEPPVPEGALQA